MFYCIPLPAIVVVLFINDKRRKFPAWRQMPSIKPTTKYTALRHRKKTYPKKKPLKKTLKVDGKNVNTQNRRQMTEKGGLRQREGNECHDN